MTSPTMLPVACVMSGGPSDGTRYEFGYLPVALGVRSPERGFYKRTDKTTLDGARIFRFEAFDD